MAEWLSMRAQLWWSVVSLAQILSVEMALLIRPCCGGAPRATTRRTYN